MDTYNTDDDLLPLELKFAQAGLEAAQKLRERNKETSEEATETSEEATETSTSPSSVATAIRPPPELLQTADDILPNDDEEGEEDEAQNIRDVDGNVGPNAQLDAPEDYYDELEDVKDLGFARGVKLPEPIGMRAMNDLTFSSLESLK